MELLKRRIIYILALFSLFLAGCEAIEPLSGIGKGLGDLFKNFKLPGP